MIIKTGKLHIKTTSTLTVRVSPLTPSLEIGRRNIHNEDYNRSSNVVVLIK